jgi:hypothetical protein
MNQTITVAKVVEILRTNLLEEGKVMNNLIAGDLYAAEIRVRDMLHEVFNGVMDDVLSHAAVEVNNQVRQSYESEGMKGLELRPLEIELHTGYRVKVESLYAKRVESGHHGSRHLLVRHWSVNAHCSPLRSSQVSMSGALSPSYDIGNELIKVFGSDQSTSRVRGIVNSFATWCEGHEVQLVLSSGETLAGKRVVVSTDGGRARTRQYKTGEQALEHKDQRKSPYDTPWCEPKLFVIQIVDEHGEISRKELPVYGVRFGEKEMLALLLDYLKALHIEQASGVQIVADGAPWIWSNLKALLIEAGVCESKIVETLDYPHASEYLTKLIGQMPSRVSEARKKRLYEEFRTLLWEGKVLQIVEQCRRLFKRPSQEVQRWINYLEKHCQKTQYAHFKANNWLCGSGIVESGIRRIINLRFKNPGTFWYQQTVEKLFLIRSVCLAKRWNIFMKNYVKIEHY